MAMGHIVRLEMPSLTGLVQAGREYFAKPKAAPVEDLEALPYKTLLDRELDQQRMTRAEQEDCNELHALRAALYSGD